METPRFNLADALPIRMEEPGMRSSGLMCRAMAMVISLFILVAGIHQTAIAGDSCALRISILTCGVGEELYSCYGHSAIRIVDTCHGTDVVYNYGTFNFDDPDFYVKFTRGKLPYYVNDEAFQSFMRLYMAEGRGVYEQVLALSREDAVKVQVFLENNCEEENKYYHYDFLLDNCSTRVRDVFQKLFAGRMQFGYAMANDSCSFRDILDIYEKEKHWERFGINLLMSNVVDQKMSNLQSMFLPDYLMKGFAGAFIDGHLLVRETITLLPQQVQITQHANQPKIVLWSLLLVVVLISWNKRLRGILMYFDVFLFLILGLLGCFMLFMWLGTEHAVCSWNRNIYWAFPLHLMFAFLIPRNSDAVVKYASYASWLLILSLFYGMVAEQAYIPEITPLILLILFRLNRYSVQASFSAFQTKFTRS